MLLQIIIGLIGVAVGAYIIWKPHLFLELIGEHAWMEKLFGPGHGTTGYQVIGLVIIVISFIIMTGMIEGLIGAIFSPLTGN
jgi:hypothetical protein